MVVGYTSTLNQKTLDEALKDIDGDTTALLIAISTKPDASSSPQVEQSNNQNKSYTLDQWDEITQEHEVVGGAAIITCTNSSGGYGYVWSSIPMRAPNRYALLAGTDTVPGKNLQNLGSCTGDAENHVCAIKEGASLFTADAATGNVIWSETIKIDNKLVTLRNATLSCKHGGTVSIAANPLFEEERGWQHLKVGELRLSGSSISSQKLAEAAKSINGTKASNLIVHPSKWESEDMKKKAQENGEEADLKAFIADYKTKSDFFTFIEGKLLEEIPKCLRYNGNDKEKYVEPSDLTGSEWAYICTQVWVKQGEKGLQTTGAYRGMKHYVYCALNLHQSQDKDHQQYKDDLCTPITSIPEGTSFANETEDTFYKNRFNNVLEIIGKLIWSDNKVNEVVKTCESLYTETGIYVDPRLVMAIIINEGTCSFNTYPNIKPKGSDKGNVADANFDRDVQRGLENIVWGKHAAFGTYSLAYKQRIGFGYPAPADIFSYINHSTPYGHLVRWRAGTVHEYSQNDRGTYPISIFPYAQNVGQAKALRDTFGVLCGDATGYAAIRYSNYVATYQLKSPYFPFSSLYPQYAGWLPGDTIPDEWKYIDHTDAINPSGYGASTQTAQKSSFAFILGPNTNNNASEARWSVGYINADNATYTHSWDYYQKVPESDKKYDG